MNKRENLNKMVVMMLETGPMPASVIYGKINLAHPEALRNDKISGFRGFVKVINQFDNVKQLGKFGKKYALK